MHEGRRLAGRNHALYYIPCGQASVDHCLRFLLFLLYLNVGSGFSVSWCSVYACVSAVLVGRVNGCGWGTRKGCS